MAARILSNDALRAGDPRAALTPEQALLGGVLERARDDLETYSGIDHPNARAEVARVLAWIQSDHVGPNEFGFSFVFVCTSLNLSPEYVRELLLGERTRECA